MSDVADSIIPSEISSCTKPSPEGKIICLFVGERMAGASKERFGWHEGNI